MSCRSSVPLCSLIACHIVGKYSNVRIYTPALETRLVGTTWFRPNSIVSARWLLLQTRDSGLLWFVRWTMSSRHATVISVSNCFTSSRYLYTFNSLYLQAPQGMLTTIILFFIRKFHLLWWILNVIHLYTVQFTFYLF